MPLSARRSPIRGLLSLFEKGGAEARHLRCGQPEQVDYDQVTSRSLNHAKGRKSTGLEHRFGTAWPLNPAL
jgi:hypothetical protein